MLISNIVISDLYQTTYFLSKEEQQDTCSSAEFSLPIHTNPLTFYQIKSSKYMPISRIVSSNSYQTTYKLAMEV